MRAPPVASYKYHTQSKRLRPHHTGLVSQHLPILYWEVHEKRPIRTRYSNCCCVVRFHGVLGFCRFQFVSGSTSTMPVSKALQLQTPA